MTQKNDKTARPERLYGTRLIGVHSVTGTVHVIRDESELPYFREGEILVATNIESKWVKQLSEAKALIEDADAKNSQAKQLSSHFDIAAVVAVKDAVSSLRSGDIVTIHASGEIELRSEHRAPDSPMRVSVPAAVDARCNTGVIRASNMTAFSDHVKANNDSAGPVDDELGSNSDDKS